MLYCKDEILGIIFVDHKCCLWSRIGTVKSRAVDRSTIQFWKLLVTVSNFPFINILKVLSVLTVYCLRLPYAHHYNLLLIRNRSRILT